MLKSPEEYLSALEFDSGDHAAGKPKLSVGERAFVEKYLGLAALEQLPEVSPEPVLLLAPEPTPLPQHLPVVAPPRPLLPPAPQIVVAPPSVAVEVASSEAPAPAATPPEPEAATAEDVQVTAQVEPPQETLPVATAPREEAVQAEADVAAAEVTAEETVAVADAVPAGEIAAAATVITAESASEATVEVAEQEAAVVETAEVASVATETAAEVVAREQIASGQAQATAAEATEIAAEAPTVNAAVELRAAQAVAAPVRQAETVKADVLLREKLRQQAQVQLVSFFVSGQIFLLPVEGIQEVLRHMELIKVPQAPDFVAGAINLRGHVTPVVYLSALLTDKEVSPYNESNFIIITGTESLRLGLVIDKVSSMHLVPQNKFIWNPESKLADAAEFLNAIVDLDDRVCGMVAPEAITRLILPEA